MIRLDMKAKSFAALFVMLLATGSWAQDAPALEDEKSKVSYSIGVNIGSSLKRQGAEVDLDLLARGIKDALGNGPIALSEQEIRDILTAYQQKLQAAREDLRKRIAEENTKKAEEFLAENKSKPGVVTTESGLQYRILAEGSGPTPGSNDTVTVHYRGTLLDGTEFDSSYKRNQPWTAPLSRCIKGWSEALRKMKCGAKWQLFIPPALAYGNSPPIGSAIPPGALLIFEVELITNTPPAPLTPLTSDIIKVPSLEEMKKGAKIETIKAEEFEKLQKQLQQQQQNK